MSRVTLATRVLFGMGQIPEQVKVQGFNTFLFFYFTQVLGLSGTLAGAAVFIALAFDAANDPIIGSLSDGWRSKWGRRHPFMVFAAAPLAVSWIFLYSPPAGLGQLGLFLWLTIFASAVRTAMTFNHIPHLALGAELAHDSAERTSLVAWRVTLALVGGSAVTLLAYRFFFPDRPALDNPLLDPSGYPGYAWFSAAVMTAAILIAVLGTRRHIGRLPKAPATSPPFSMRRVLGEVAEAWRNRAFRALFCGYALFGVFFGVVSVLVTHLNVFFWELDSRELQISTGALAIGFLAGIGCVGIAHHRFGKLRVLLVSAVTAATFASAPVVLRLLDWFPGNDSPALFPLVAGSLLVTTVLAAVGFVSVDSMMADVVAAHEVRAGAARGGIFFSASSFSGKMSSGLGHAIAGVGLDLIEFPLKAQPSQVPSAKVAELGALTLAATVLAVAAMWAFRSYRLEE